MRARAALAIAAWLACAAAFAQEFPPLTGRVVDRAALLPAATEAALAQRLEALEAGGAGPQLVIVTLVSLGGYDIADYGYRLGREWGIGDAERNDGLLLIVAPNERKVRIEVGYGLEGVITDAFAGAVIRRSILPRFREGDVEGGIDAGVAALEQQLALPPDEARERAQAARDEDEGRTLDPVFFFWIVFLLIFVMPMIRRSRRRGRRRHGAGPVIIWGGGGGGFGGGGGGGFGGGGGGFGGGGASGGW